jgi:hypothetical protein
MTIELRVYYYIAFSVSLYRCQSGCQQILIVHAFRLSEGLRFSIVMKVYVVDQ